MKKSDEIRRKTWRMIAKNLIVLAALAVAAVIGVMSWFTHKTSATADGISMECEAPPGLDIAIVDPSYSGDTLTSYLSDNSHWHTGTINMFASEYKFLENLFFCEVTGDGTTFQSPVLDQANGIATVNTESNQWSAAIPNEDYLTFDLYMRSEKSLNVYLDSGTEIAPLSDPLTSENGTVFSPDSVVGAARFSIINGNTRTLLWIPAPNIFYDAGGNNNEGTVNEAVFTVNNTYGPQYIDGNGDTQVRTDGTYNHAYYDINKTRQVITHGTVGFISNNDSNNKYKLGKAGANNKNFSVATLSQQSNGYYTNHVRVNLWLEGEDAEARLAMVGGKFKMTLKLTLNE